MPSCLLEKKPYDLVWRTRYPVNALYRWPDGMVYHLHRQDLLGLKSLCGAGLLYEHCIIARPEDSERARKTWRLCRRCQRILNINKRTL